MLRKKSSEGVSCRSEKGKCLQVVSVYIREFKCDVKQNSRLYKKEKMKRRFSEIEDALLANRRGVLSQIEGPNFFLFKRAVSFLKSRAPLSKAGAVRNHEAGNLSGRVVTRHVRLGALRTLI